MTTNLLWGKRTYIMGIINVTPDSFSGDGLLSQMGPVEAARQQAEQFIAEGADIIDIGGESTRPGADPISAEMECQRILPVIQAVARDFPKKIISVDTYKASVAQKALDAGADWVNDIWGLRADPDMAKIVSDTQVPVILMHNRLQPNSTDLQAKLGGRYIGVNYRNLLEDIQEELRISIALAHQAGIRDDHIILDPGIGFGKTVTQNLKLLKHLDVFKAMGYPLLLGPSRKSFIGYTLDLPPDEREEGTAAAVAVGIMRGADIIRVHDVRTMARVARMTDAILQSD
jgi:dihydropteroate synthase